MSKKQPSGTPPKPPSSKKPDEGKSKTLHNGHDLFSRRELADLVLASELFSKFLKEDLRRHLDLERLVLDKETYVDEDLDELICDVTYRVPCRDRDAFVSIILEHKSEGMARSGGSNLPFQLRSQEHAVMKHYRRNHPKGKLPIVILVVLYHGKSTYKGPRKVSETMPGP